MFCLYMSKNIVIVSATYVHISYLDTLYISSYHLCALQIKETHINGTQKVLKVEICSIVIEAREVSTSIFLSHCNGFLS